MAVFAPYLNFMWESAKDIGLDPEELFSEAGIDPTLRFDTNARISDVKLDTLVWLASKKCKDEAFVFHISENMHPSYLGVMGYAWLSSASLREGFDRLARYQRLLTDDAIIELIDHGDSFHVVLDWHTKELHDAELRETLRLANAVKICRMNCGDSFKPTRVEFKQAIPQQPAAYYAYFRCELVFDAPSSVMVLDTSVADEHLPGSNPQLEMLLEQQILEYLAKLDKNDIVGLAKSQIFDLLPSGQASIEDVAGKLHLSVRTLRRKLKDAGTSFKDLLAETRRELGQRYIQDSSLSLTEVAFMLGFSDSSSFSRAYKGWTGKSPSESRAQA